MNELLFYDNISEFKRQFYKDLLTRDNITSSEIHINKISYPEESTDDRANFWGYVLEKDGIKYLLSSKTSDGKEIKLSEIFPIKVKQKLKVSTKGQVHYMIKSYDSMRFKPTAHMTFKKLVDTLAGFKTTNPTHSKLYWMMTLASMYSRCNFRVATPPAFGKDSAISIINNLIGGASTILSPTLAKLEYFTFNKLLCINEVVDIGKAEWMLIEQFLLDVGDFKPDMTKHSRAIAQGTKEVMNISHLSMTLLYNDIDNYVDPSDYFDFISKQSIKNRFPSFRLWGTVQESFKRDRDIDNFIKNHRADYLKLIETYEYYKQNYSNVELKYKTDLPFNLPERWMTSINRLLVLINIYSESQEEYNEWCKVILESIADYRAMLIYPSLLKETYIKLRIPKTYSDKFKNIQDTIHYLSAKEDDNVGIFIKTQQANTFIEKNSILKESVKQKIYKDENKSTIWS